MRALLACLALTSSLGLAACASVSGEAYVKPGFDLNQVARVGVVDGKDAVYAEDTRQSILDMFQLEFFRRGWDVVERSNIQRAIDELDFQNSDFTNASDRGSLGEVLNVDALIVVNLASIGDEISMTVKMFETETGDILWMGSGDGALNKGLGALAGAIVGAAIGDEVSDHGGASIGAGVGGALGYQLGPSQLENAKKLVKAICAELPRRG